MNHKRRITRAALAALCCLALLLGGCTGPRRRGNTVTLWYAETDCPRDVMDALLACCRADGAATVLGVCFADEAALGAAFEDGRPDLLFCSQFRAVQIDGRDPLGRLPEALPVPDTLAGLSPAAGASFFPLGSRLPLLLGNTALTDMDFDSLEALLDTAGNRPFLGCGCWADLLYTATASAGRPMCGLPERDRENPVYAALYNRLALAAFRGGLAQADPAADYVRQGLLPCAVLRSTALAGIRDEGLDVQPLPLPEGSEARRPAELMGFALLGGADTASAEAFLRWLWSGRGNEAALAAGLVPIAQAGPAPGSEDRLGSLLFSLSGSGTLYWPDAEDAYFRNRARCECELRAALDYLS